MTLIFFLAGGTEVSAQTVYASFSGSSAETDALYREMLSSVEGTISISADVWQQIRLFGQDYTAWGTYNELEDRPESRGKGAVQFRLDLQVRSPADAKEVKSPNTLTIVRDHSFNFIYRYFVLEEEKRMERIDIKRLVEAIEKQGRNDLPTEAGSMFALGGLAGMLREMRNRYDFNTAPLKTQIQEKNNAVAVWRVRGRLKPEILAELTSDASGKKTVVPRHMPTTIDISIGVNDRFPYRFDYYWMPDGSDPTAESFANLLFYNLELNSPGIVPSLFDYSPSEYIDITDKVIQRMLR